MGRLLRGKNIIVMGVRNKWSIAWGIAAAAHKEGASLIFTYQGEQEKGGVEQLAAELGNVYTYQLNVTSDSEIDIFFDTLREKYGVIHGIVHAIAYARKQDLQESFVSTQRDGFALALDISAYSLVSVSRKARGLMTEGGSILTLTYMGSEKVFKNYNVMGVAKAALETSVMYLANDLGPEGIRVNAISAGAVKTLSARGIKDFGSILAISREKAPLRKNVELKEIGDASVFLLSSMSNGITGEVIHVDCGMHIMGI
ncbi:MAG: enoyl-ACP reductase [Clostridiaceae bacterium]